MDSWPLLTVYALFLALCLHGLHRALLCLRVLLPGRARREGEAVDAHTQAKPDDVPHVTVQLPIFEEFYVAERLIDAVAALDWPRERMQIQVLDDSRVDTPDETRALVARVVQKWRIAGVDIAQLCRDERAGFKAGALAAGLAHESEPARGDFVAIFDADFVPRPDFLRASIPLFAHDPMLAVVQGRWTHINRAHSLLCRAQACFLDAHFAVEHEARQRAGHFLNFNGTAGVWRKEAIEDAGAWSHDTLTEDLDLSLRAQMRGWRFAYVHELEVPAELPIEMRGFKQQQRRWAKGSVQCAKKLLARIWTSPGLRVSTRVEASVHMLNNLSWLVMLCVALLSLPVAIEVALGESWWTATLDRVVLFGGLLPVLAYLWVGQLRCGRGALASLPQVGIALVLGMGLVVNGAWAALSGAFGRVGVFERTPKYRAEQKSDSWVDKKYRARRLRFDALAALEIALGLECASAAIVGVRARAWGFAFFFALFAIGLLWVGAASALPQTFEALRARRRRRAPASTSSKPSA